MVLQYFWYWKIVLPKLPTGPTANLNGLKDVDVKTDDVNDDKADDISGDWPPEGRSPNDGKSGGPVPGVVGPGLVMEGWQFRGVRSRAPMELSDGAGLVACCDDGGRGI